MTANSQPANSQPVNSRRIKQLDAYTGLYRDTLYGQVLIEQGPGSLYHRLRRKDQPGGY